MAMLGVSRGPVFEVKPVQVKVCELDTDIWKYLVVWGGVGASGRLCWPMSTLA